MCACRSPRLPMRTTPPKAIAVRLGINHKTMNGCHANIMLKLQARDLIIYRKRLCVSV